MSNIFKTWETRESQPSEKFGSLTLYELSRDENVVFYAGSAGVDGYAAYAWKWIVNDDFQDVSDVRCMPESEFLKFLSDVPQVAYNIRYAGGFYGVQL